MKISAQPRSKGSKTACRALRREGRIPAVVYGTGDPMCITVADREFSRVARRLGENTLIDLDIDGKGTKTVIMKELQEDPISRKILHADFYQLPMDRRIRIHVPLSFQGQPAGVEMGGILEPQLRELLVECLPTNIPQEIPVDVSELELGGRLHVSDLSTPENVTVLDDAERAVVSVLMPRVEEEAKPEVEEAAEVPPEEGAEAAPAEGEEKPGEKPEEKPAEEKDAEKKKKKK